MPTRRPILARPFGQTGSGRCPKAITRTSSACRALTSPRSQWFAAALTAGFSSIVGSSKTLPSHRRYLESSISAAVLDFIPAVVPDFIPTG